MDIMKQLLTLDDIKETSKMAKDMVMEPTTGMMVTDLKGIMKMAIQVMEFITTRLVTNTKDILRIGKSMVMEFTIGIQNLS